MEKLLECINNEAVLYLMLRLVLGILFLFQGYDKVFRVGMKGVAESFEAQLGKIKVPKGVLSLSAFFTSYVELIGGVLLILGFFKNFALLFLGIDIVIVTIAFSMIKPMWDMQLFFPRLILIAILLYLPQEWDVLSLDYLFRTNC